MQDLAALNQAVDFLNTVNKHSLQPTITDNFGVFYEQN